MEHQQEHPRPRRLGRCAECGLAVVVDEHDEVIRACPHTAAAVLVDLAGTASGTARASA